MGVAGVAGVVDYPLSPFCMLVMSNIVICYCQKCRIHIRWLAFSLTFRWASMLS